MSNIYLIRHGKTSANEKSLYCGHNDVSLCESGRTEIHTLKGEISYPEANFYVTSGLTRANETLEIIAPKIQYVTNINLKEYNFGEFEMKNHDELQGDERYQKWISDKDGDVRCPNGESRKDFVKRIREGFEQIMRLTEDVEDISVFVVVHGGVISTLMEIFFEDEKNIYEWLPRNGRGYKLTVSNGNVVEYSDI